jgi:hypothetical protein
MFWRDWAFEPIEEEPSRRSKNKLSVVIGISYLFVLLFVLHSIDLLLTDSLQDSAE